MPHLHGAFSQTSDRKVGSLQSVCPATLDPACTRLSPQTLLRGPVLLLRTLKTTWIIRSCSCQPFHTLISRCPVSPSAGSWPPGSAGLCPRGRQLGGVQDGSDPVPGPPPWGPASAAWKLCPASLPPLGRRLPPPATPPCGFGILGGACAPGWLAAPVRGAREAAQGCAPCKQLCAGSARGRGWTDWGGGLLYGHMPAFLRPTPVCTVFAHTPGDSREKFPESLGWQFKYKKGFV